MKFKRLYKLDKESFVYIMNSLKEYNEKVHHMNDAIEDVFGEYSFIGYNIPHDDIILDLLDIMLGLEDTELLSWWLYEDAEKIIYIRNQEDSENSVKYTYSTVDVTTPEQLYDYIISETKGLYNFRNKGETDNESRTCTV